MIEHKIRGILLGLDSRGNRYECVCGWLSKRYRGEAQREAAYAKAEAHAA